MGTYDESTVKLCKVGGLAERKGEWSTHTDILRPWHIGKTAHCFSRFSRLIDHHGIEVNNSSNTPLVICRIFWFYHPHPNPVVWGVPNGLIPLDQGTGDGIFVVFDGEKQSDLCCLHQTEFVVFWADLDQDTIILRGWGLTPVPCGSHPNPFSVHPAYT